MLRPLRPSLWPGECPLPPAADIPSYKTMSKGRDRASLLDRERRVDRIGGVVHRHNQIELRLSGKPGKPAAVLVQHHAFARFARPLATVRPATRGALHQPRRVQLRLGPGVAPAEPVLLSDVL